MPARRCLNRRDASLSDDAGCATASVRGGLMKDTPAPTDMEARWQRWAAQTRAWGPRGNERMTTSVGLVLLVLLGLETLTTLTLHSYLPEHIFLGLLLVPPVALKLASTGWRFVRYYANSRPYRLEGPPRLLLRLLAPLLVVST